MNWLHTEMAWLNIMSGAVGFGVNWLLQSTLLLGVGLTLGRLLRTRGSAVQSVVYRTTLVAVLACPFATWMFSLTGVPGWSLEMPAAWTIQEASAPLSTDLAISVPEEVAALTTSNAPLLDESSNPQTSPTTLVASAYGNQSPTGAVLPDRGMGQEPVGVAQSDIIPARTTVHRFGFWSIVLSCIWLAVMSILTARLALAWWRLALLLRNAVRAEPATIGECRALASQLEVPAPDVLQSPFVPSPCLTGFRRPAILMPDGEMGLSVRDVLIHELAHLRRSDCHWNLLRQLATAVFFFQPMLWILSRRLEAAAEEVCDDYVVQFGGDPQEYAHRLVDIAERYSAPLAVGVGIVSLRSMLAKRVARIMDTSRSLSTRVGSLLQTLVLIGGLIGTTIVGFVGVGAQPSLAEPERASNEAENVTLRAENNDENHRGTAHSTSPALTITGTVVDMHGKPVADGHVAAIGKRIQISRGGDLTPSFEVLDEGTTDKLGQYKLKLKGVSSKTHRYAKLIARKDGLAIGWQVLNLDASSFQASLELMPVEPIRGKLVDIEGQPAAGVRMLIRSVNTRTKDGKPIRDGVGYRGGDKIPAAWLRPVTSDEQGGFTVNGIPAGHGVVFEVAGSDRFASQSIALNTGMAEQRGERDATYRSLVKNVNTGEEAVLPLAPAQIFEGTVTYQDTGKPAPHARVTIWASQQERFGSMISVAGKANAEGHYRISPKSGVRFGVTAYPPDGAAYLARRIPSSQAIHWESGDRSKKVDITLPRGVLVRGKVVEAGSSQPVVGASIQYIPEDANNIHVSDDILTGSGDVQVTNKNGDFEIAVLPGPGRLVVHGPKGNYILQQIGGRQLSRGMPGGWRYYVHAINKVDLKPGSDPIRVTIELQRGTSVAGNIVDEQGHSVDEVLVISRLTISPTAFWWRGHIVPTLGGRFELSGLTEDHDYTVHFLAAKRRLGATATIRAVSDTTDVVLQPCGEASARFVDSDGQPHVAFQPSLEMVVTKGAHRYDSAAERRGELAADSDYIANIDRTNYWRGPKTDKQGHATFAALIPGATYRFTWTKNGKPRVLKEFSVKSGERLDLGEISIDRSP